MSNSPCCFDAFQLFSVGLFVSVTGSVCDLNITRSSSREARIVRERILTVRTIKLNRVLTPANNSTFCIEKTAL